MSKILNKTFVYPFYFLAQILFTASETELNYYHQNVNVVVELCVAEQLKT